MSTRADHEREREDKRQFDLIWDTRKRAEAFSLLIVAQILTSFFLSTFAWPFWEDVTTAPAMFSVWQTRHAS